MKAPPKHVCQGCSSSRQSLMRMKEDESISNFNIKPRDIANTYFALREKMSREKLARKILRSLPKMFDIKVTTIEEA